MFMISFLLLGIIFNICSIFAKIIDLVSSPWTQWTRFKLEVPFYQIFTHLVCLLILCMLSHEYASHYVFHQYPSCHSTLDRSASGRYNHTCLWGQSLSTEMKLDIINHFSCPLFLLNYVPLSLRQSRGGL